MALVVLVYLGKWIIWIFSDMLNLEWIAFFKCFCWTNRRLFIVKMNHLNFILPHPLMLKIELDFKIHSILCMEELGVFIIHRYITFINRSQSTQGSCVAFKWMEFPFSRGIKSLFVQQTLSRHRKSLNLSFLKSH